MPTARSLFLPLAAALVVVAACGGDDDSVPLATPTPEPPTVMVRITGGCDAPEPERGFEALGLVRVTDADGDAVAGAEVEGTIAGPGVAAEATATDETFTDGEALLFFPVTETGIHTITVTSVTLPRAIAARFDPESTLAAEFDVVGADCVWP